MSMPQRPRDNNLASIIDRLANFVARNGEEFEEMTKIKQQANSNFAFLYPGNENNSYYQFKVMEERRNLQGMSTIASNSQSKNCVCVFRNATATSNKLPAATAAEYLVQQRNSPAAERCKLYRPNRHHQHSADEVARTNHAIGKESIGSASGKFGQHICTHHESCPYIYLDSSKFYHISLHKPLRQLILVIIRSFDNSTIK